MIKRKLSYLSILAISFTLYHCYHHFFSKDMLTGSYVNINFEYGPFVAEIPYGQDTITLNLDNSFSSTYWGDGKYEIDYSLSGTELRLLYNYELGKAELRRNIERKFFSQPRIVLFQDANHYMEKINY